MCFLMKGTIEIQTQLLNYMLAILKKHVCKLIMYYWNRGYSETEKNPKGTCATGYQDKLCSVCAPGYSRSGEFACEKCPPLALNIFFIIWGIVGLLTIIVILVVSTLYSDAKRRFKFNVLFRVFMNHVQLMVLTISFNFNWPVNIENSMSWFKQITYLTNRIVSLDCIIDNGNRNRYLSFC